MLHSTSPCPYLQPYVDHFTRDKMLHPLSDVPKPKSSFIPSKWERRKIVKLVHAIKMGWIKPRARPEKPKFYILWSDNEQVNVLYHAWCITLPPSSLLPSCPSFFTLPPLPFSSPTLPLPLPCRLIVPNIVCTFLPLR